MAATSHPRVPAGPSSSRRISRLSAALLFFCVALPAQQTLRVLPREVLERPFPVTLQTLRADLAFLTDPLLGGREAGTRDESVAAAYVAAAFMAAGLEPGGEAGAWVTPFRFRKLTRTESGTTIRAATSRNVLGWLRGRQRAKDEDVSKRPYILVGAHIDHLGVDSKGRRFAGADDNASGVTGLLAMARALARTEPRLHHDVLFVGFGAEEQGLRGARHYVANPARPLARLTAMINLDMIGRPRFLDRKSLALPKRLMGIADGPGVGILSGPKDRRLLELARAACAVDRLPAYAPADFPMLEKTIRNMSEGRADHAPFAAKGVPHLFFSTSEHDDYHLPGDTLEKVDPVVIRRIALAATRTLLAIDHEKAKKPETQDG